MIGGVGEEGGMSDATALQLVKYLPDTWVYHDVPIAQFCTSPWKLSNLLPIGGVLCYVGTFLSRLV